MPWMEYRSIVLPCDPEPKEKSVDNESSSTKETRKSSAAKLYQHMKLRRCSKARKGSARSCPGAGRLQRRKQKKRTKRSLMRNVETCFRLCTPAFPQTRSRLLWHYSTCTDARNTALTHRRATTDLAGVNRSQVLNHLIETGNFETDEFHMGATSAMRSGDQLEGSSARADHVRLTELSTLELWNLPFDGYLTLH